MGGGGVGRMSVGETVVPLTDRVRPTRFKISVRFSPVIFLLFLTAKMSFGPGGSSLDPFI